MVKPCVRKGERPGNETYYLKYPIDIVRTFNITTTDELVLSIEMKDDNISLCYRRAMK
ncbi:AbrB/MazE/SpoVT family DNA-binding domain-containing protein [Saccharolobus solfataricus]|uniref:AbrB/MazE/SpoVT family DNA-binding domain-containing protein n=1 Tax=Saccharolobus solfataricus TaxID=2287 RepID=A0A3G8EUD1_SACSO|nr:AbrB/MazE/SpoVT family DNA-binding domain-containing protein [Saccharolobus solfataricus]AYN75805.1 AbrB/MazE/SpoVT family DNA-binding domain-containing protein [Saccharolobus solfataricus]AYP18641.1 AbrB/MazE/SpoVT family DNA-binding domain-containing protein [Saccharolobus solfataricus]AZF69509.1 AbrB/MazE/SpoVT family DNA-binding domain-containing protein [Saccharolobus solfataricus]AZF72129.1 AbrB/MazE/SpoVT family DNA-binding domain-containing protein [Saccharolobus solfataricus]